MSRFKRALFGYRRKEVDESLELVEGRAFAAERRAASADHELLMLSEMFISREREAGLLKEQLAHANERHDRSLKSLEILAGRIEELHAQARGQATRIRMKALDDAVKVSARAGDALSVIDEIEQAANGLRESAQFEVASNDVDANGVGANDVDANGVGADALAELRSVDTAPTGAEGDLPIQIHRTTDPSNGSDPAAVYQGDVEVEIGPLGDFSQLLGFETAAGSIRGLNEVSVQKFAGGRATLGLHLDEPIALLRELEELAPFEFRVRQSGEGRLVLDIEDESAAEVS